MSDWEVGSFVLGQLGDGNLAQPIGPVHVQGLEAALECTAAVKRGALTSIPDVAVSPVGGERSECGRWLGSWQQGGERRDLLLRDNPRKRWLALREGWITSRQRDGGAVICLECAEPTDGPSL